MKSVAAFTGILLAFVAFAMAFPVTAQTSREIFRPKPGYETPASQMKKYMEDMRTRIRRNWTPMRYSNNYPPPVVKMVLSKKGHLLGYKIDRSSGVKEFDQVALNAVKTSAPFPPLPYGLRTTKDTLTVYFSFAF